MRPKNSRKPLHSDAAPKVRRPPGSPTKSQLRALANAEAQARVAKWKTLIAVAGATWSKLHTVELNRSNGDVNVVAGLVQMHYRISRQDADAQVKAFFDQHMPAAPTPPPVIAVRAPVIATPEFLYTPEAAVGEAV